jgi:ribosomal protein S18 acetylase RimI-like enzyme
MPVQILRARLKDAYAISKLECECYKIKWHPYALWVWTRATKLWWPLKAVDRGKIIGGTLALPTKDPRMIYIDTLFVHKNYRRSGIAKRLVDRIMKDTHATRIQADIAIRPPVEASLTLFKKLGFRRLKTMKNYYRENRDYTLFELRRNKSRNRK